MTQLSDQILAPDVHNETSFPSASSTTARKGVLVNQTTIRRRKGELLSLASFLALALQCYPVSAQDFSGMIDSSFANMSSFAGTTAVNSAIAESARYAARRSGRAQSHTQPTTPAPKPSNLKFRSSAAVTAQTNHRILAALKQNSPKTDTRNFEHVLNNGELRGTFARLLQSAGFSSNDLADVLMGYLVISWEVVNDEDSRLHVAGYAIVRNRLRESLGADPRIARLTDGDKQQFAETLEVLAILAAATRDGLKQAGRTDQLTALQEGVRRAGQNLGVDFQQLAFTDTGFVPR
ncbi:DUF6683 family protein [Sphingomonas lycopersici]|uniref:Uncharacterized protein n=1 Tax=Sphingomonas lycopersici TaxID=2951807 RepID=A0AA41ZDL7_9SPHN|nr:DUF6683 family protein [Sphingomonas lycopersici]MCW6537728.1 hypothetical protein [Sphingomonas lycopersici]